MPAESTTPDLVELVREAFEATFRDLDAGMHFFAPDAVWEIVALGTSFEGATAIGGFLEDWVGDFEDSEIEPEEILDLGNGVAFGVFVLKGRPLGSIGHIHQRTAYVYVWVQGKIVRLTSYHDIDEARAAAERLAESRAQADV